MIGKINVPVNVYVYHQFTGWICQLKRINFVDELVKVFLWFNAKKITRHVPRVNIVLGAFIGTCVTLIIVAIVVDAQQEIGGNQIVVF